MNHVSWLTPRRKHTKLLGRPSPQCMPSATLESYRRRNERRHHHHRHQPCRRLCQCRRRGRRRRRPRRLRHLRRRQRRIPQTYTRHACTHGRTQASTPRTHTLYARMHARTHARTLTHAHHACTHVMHVSRSARKGCLLWLGSGARPRKVRACAVCVPCRQAIPGMLWALPRRPRRVQSPLGRFDPAKPNFLRACCGLHLRRGEVRAARKDDRRDSPSVQSGVVPRKKVPR